MDEINLVYIDDDLEEDISRYLVKEYRKSGFEINYEEISFKSGEGYETLLSNNIITESNIILIDSKLFENDHASTGKFSGEEFKMILKKVFPFIEVIVITQNDLEEDYGTLAKYRGDLEETPLQYYENRLKDELDKAIHSVCIYRNIANKLKLNDGIDKVLIEKIISSLDGKSLYDELTTDDIDEIILAFEELQRDKDEEWL